MLNNADGQELLAVVTSMHHKTVDQSFCDWALGLAETSLLEAPSRVGGEASIFGLHCYVILKRDIADLCGFEL